MDIAERIDLAQKLLRVERSQLIDSAFNLGEFAGLDATYFCIPEKGGSALIVADNGEVLFASSSIGFDDHLAAYKEGIRTPFEAFEIEDSSGKPEAQSERDKGQSPHA